MKTNTASEIVAGLAVGVALAALPAQAYQISHSYPDPANGTEYHGSCENGARIVIVEQSAGGFRYKGPAGNGTLSAGADLDAAARKACGE